MREVWVRKCKRPSAQAVWGTYEIASDEHGVWLYTPEGSRFRSTSDNGTEGECFVGQPEAPGLHVMQLVPSGDAWWFGHWKSFRGLPTMSIDVCTPAVFAGDAWTYVDLELDVYRSGDGAIGVFDQDELEDAVAHGLISEEERRTCLDVAAELEARLRAGDDPVFDGLAWSRLEAATALDLRPLTDVA